MRVPVGLSEAFGEPFEQLIARFLADKGLLPDTASLRSQRFLSRSVAPHVKKLSDLFNRQLAREIQDPYWKQSANPAHLRLAYFLSFMPCNLYRVASVWSELARLGYRWPAAAGSRLRAIEFGAGPAAGACGIAAGEKHAPLGLPGSGDWALIERDRATLKLGAEWAESYFAQQGFSEWGTRTFHRTIELGEEKGGFLPRSAPKFNLWVMSFFLNELLETLPAEKVAARLMESWELHLEEESLVLLIEPALKLQSRKLLELRAALLSEASRSKAGWLKVLLPCLGHQTCGALSDAEDWCHEEASWWRPPYLKTIDQMTGLDRKTLPFSYLVIAKSPRSREELLPGLAGGNSSATQRLVSPAHDEGREVEFFICGQAGKRRARYRPPSPDARPERGDILLGVELRGDSHASRIERVSRIAGKDAESK